MRSFIEDRLAELEDDPEERARFECQMRSGYQNVVYFLQLVTPNPELCPVKIGRSTHAAKRIGSLRGGYPWPIEILGIHVVKSYTECVAKESALHKQFEAHRLGGEWFEPVPAIMEEAAKARRSKGHQQLLLLYPGLAGADEEVFRYFSPINT